MPERDLTFAIVTDEDQFTTRRAADELDNLGRAADDTGRSLADLEQDAGQAGRELDDLGDDLGSLGDDARDTGRAVDDAMDKIATSTDASMRKVDADLDRGKRGLDDFKSEARQSATESAASFTGSFEDITDLVQETAAQAFAGFGALAAGAGIAAAAGLGVLVQRLLAIRERIGEIRSALTDLDIDGALTPDERTKTILDDILNNEDLRGFKDDIEAIGGNWDDFIDAVRRGPEALREFNTTINDGLINPLDQLAQADAIEYIAGVADAMEDSESSAAIYKAALEGAGLASEELSRQLEAAADDLDGFSDPVDTYTSLLAEKDAAEKESGESTRVTVDEYIDALAEQVAAQEEWAGNLKTLASRGVEEGVLAELRRMGPEGAPLVAELTTASDAELDKLASLFARQGRAAAEGTAREIADSKPKVTAAAEELRAGADNVLSRRMNIPVGLTSPSADQLWRVRRQIEAGLAGITVAPAIIRAEASERYRP